MSEDSSNSRKTMRIDLIPEMPGSPSASSPRKDVASPLTRMNWASRPKSNVPTAVARSHYQELLQSVYDAALISDLAGKITDVNVRAIEFLQYRRSDLLEKTVHDVVVGFNDVLLQALLDNLKDERFTLIQAFCTRQDGSTFPAEIAVNKLRLEEMRLCFFIRDITVRRQNEEMLRKIHHAIQITATGLVVADTQAVIELANPAFAQMLGYEDPSALVGVAIRDLLVDPTSADSFLSTVLQNADAWMSEWAFRTAQNASVTLAVSARCSRNEDDEPVGIVFSINDLALQRVQS